MNPDSSKLLWRQTCFYLVFKEIRHRLVIKGNRCERAVLLDEFDVFDE